MPLTPIFQFFQATEQNGRHLPSKLDLFSLAIIIIESTDVIITFSNLKGHCKYPFLFPTLKKKALTAFGSW